MCQGRSQACGAGQVDEHVSLHNALGSHNALGTFALQHSHPLALEFLPFPLSYEALFVVLQLKLSTARSISITSE